MAIENKDSGIEVIDLTGEYASIGDKCADELMQECILFARMFGIPETAAMFFGAQILLTLKKNSPKNPTIN